MALVKTDCLQADNATNETEQAEYETQTLTTLYVRHGLLMSFAPEKPSPEIATTLLDDFKSKLQKWQSSYKKSISSAAKVSVSKLEFVNDYIRLGWEKGETTLILDYPRLRISDGGSIFETRTCLAICTTDKGSPKIWSRVTLPVDIPEISSRLEMDQVPDLCPRFRDIADESIKWAYSKMQEILTSHLPDSRLETKGTIKVAILGIADSDLASPFERLCRDEVSAADVLRDAAFDRKLTSYCQKVSHIDGMLSSYAKQTEHHNSIWFKIPLSVLLSGGETTDRVVLFFMRDVKGYSEIIGFAYDDAERGDIALRAGAKLSKIIGPWI
jgi:hypothetical protein